MANRRFTRTVNTLHAEPTLIDCNFVVDSTNGNGLGIRNLKGPGIAKVLGYSTAPATGNNVSAGNFFVQFSDNYNRYFGGFSGFASPTSGTTSISSGLTKGKAYIIASVGTSTQANWQAVGLPLGIVPAVGAAFIASTSSAGTGTGVVIAPTVSTITSIEVVGDPNTTLQPIYQPTAFNGGSGGYLVVQCLGLPSSGQTPILTQPADGSVLGMSFYLSNSSVLLQGE